MSFIVELMNPEIEPNRRGLVRSLVANLGNPNASLAINALVRPATPTNLAGAAWPTELTASSSAPVVADAKAIAADPILRIGYPGFEENVLPAAASVEVRHPGRRSVFCFRTRLVLIFAASLIHTSIPSFASNRSNQRAYPGASIPTRTLTPRCFRSR